MIRYTNSTMQYVKIDRFIVFRSGKIYDIAKNKFKPTTTTHSGYIRASVPNIKNDTRCEYLHRFIYHSFNMGADKNLDIHHINGIRSDNRLQNLAAITHQQNTLNRVYPPRRVNRPVNAIKSDGCIERYATLTECRRVYPSNSIWGILNPNDGKTRLKCGTTFEYAD